MKEILVVLVELLGYGLAAVALTAVGVLAELNSLSYLSAGNTIFGVWLAVMGMIALYAAFSVGTDKVLPRLRAQLNSA